MPRGPVRVIALALAAIAVLFFIFGSSASSSSSRSGTYNYVVSTSERWGEGLVRYTGTEKWKLWHSTKDQKVAMTEEKLQTNKPEGDREQLDAIKLAQAEEMAKADAAGHRLLAVDAADAVDPAKTKNSPTSASDWDDDTLETLEDDDLTTKQTKQTTQTEHEKAAAAALDEAPTSVASPRHTTSKHTSEQTSLATNANSPKAATKVAASTADNSVSKALVLAKPDEKSAAWIKQEFSDWEAIIYNISSTATRVTGSTVPLRGGPALAFLTHVTENYNDLSDVTLFISTLAITPTQRKNGWVAQEKDYKAQLFELAPTLHTMNVSYVQHLGYTSLRCNPDPGCTAYTVIHPLSNTLYAQPWHHELPTAYRALFPAQSAVPVDISAPAGAQFAVSKTQIRRRTRDEYADMRDWVLDTRMDEGTLQRVMSALWHVVFGKPPVDCPDEEQCKCELWGRCDASDDAAAMLTDGKLSDELKSMEESDM